MNAILTAAFIGLVVGFFLLFGISPMEFTEGIFTRILAKPNSIKSQINEETKRKKPNIFRREISEGCGGGTGILSAAEGYLCKFRSCIRGRYSQLHNRPASMILSGQFLKCQLSDLCDPIIIAF